MQAHNLTVKKEVIMKLITQITAALTIIYSASSMAVMINERQDNQQARIQQGVVSGELTKRETVRLSKQQIKIQRKEMRFKSDGQFTKKERALVQRDLNRQNKAIYRQKHDQQQRF